MDIQEGRRAADEKGHAGGDPKEYGIVVPGDQTISKLFRVTRESRDAALAYYRIAIPAWFERCPRDGDLSISPAILRFNPETDFLRLSSIARAVPRFLHDVKTLHDPRQIGVLNLALDPDGVNGFNGLCGFKPEDDSDDVAASVRETVARLREIYFLQSQGTGRHIPGYWHNAPNNDYVENTSLPIMPMTLNLNLEIIHPDPRDIDEDLGQTFVYADPRALVKDWDAFSRQLLGDDFKSRTICKIGLALAPTVGIRNVEDAEAWLERDRKTWIQQLSHDQVNVQPHSDLRPPSAFGFWLFPPEAFSLFDDPDRNPTRAPTYMDLRKFRPSLALCHLPQAHAQPT